jgi:hypothetical protein
VRGILEKFTEVQETARGEPSRKPRGQQSQEDEVQSDVKFVKTKELQKILICNIIGVAVHLATNQRLWASVIAKTLKK